MSVIVLGLLLHVDLGNFVCRTYEIVGQQYCDDQGCGVLCGNAVHPTIAKKGIQRLLAGCSRASL